LDVLEGGEALEVRGFKIARMDSVYTAPKQVDYTQTQELNGTKIPENDTKSVYTQQDKLAIARAALAQAEAKTSVYTTPLNNEQIDKSEYVECELCHYMQEYCRVVFEDGEEHKLCDACIVKKNPFMKHSVKRLPKTGKV
jgi:hypothetical protein